MLELVANEALDGGEEERVFSDCGDGAGSFRPQSREIDGFGDGCSLPAPVIMSAKDEGAPIFPLLGTSEKEVVETA